MAKEANGVQKEIAAKKKVRPEFHSVRVRHSACEKAKENADELVAKKKDIETRVTEKRTEAKDLEAKMRQRASTVGNIVGKDVPVSMTEVRLLHPTVLVVALTGGHRTTTRRFVHGIQKARK